MQGLSMARHTGHRLGAGLVTRRPTSGWATLLVAERSLRPARIARDSLVLRASSGRVGRPEGFWLLPCATRRAASIASVVHPRANETLQLPGVAEASI